MLKLIYYGRYLFIPTNVFFSVGELLFRFVDIKLILDVLAHGLQGEIKLQNDLKESSKEGLNWLPAELLRVVGHCDKIL